MQWRKNSLARRSQKQSNSDFHQPPQVVIVGAGFAGLEVALQLANTPFDVVLIDRQNHHTFQPLLHQVATAELEPSQIAYPVRWAIRRAINVRFVLAEVVNIQTAQQFVETTAGQFPYTFLVLATGSQPKLTMVPGAEQHAFPLKTVADAIAIHHQILRCFEQALQTADPLEQQGYLTVAIVGGGTTGVELAGAMAEWIHHTLIKDYSRLNCQQIRLVLLHSGHELLLGFHPRLQRYALKHLQNLGVEVRLQTRVNKVTAEGIHLGNGGFIPAKTVIWTAGVQANQPDQDGQPPIYPRVPVLPTLQMADHPDIYALGDVAASGQTPLPMLASVAVQQGRATAINLQRHALGKCPLPFRYRPMGSMAILSRQAAVMQMGRLTLTGSIAWLFWLGVHVALLRGVRHRLLTLLHWGVSYCFRERASQLLWQTSPIESRRSVPKGSI
ncbi:FAD-dependent oxidoreductase [filamentous cyanobacterium CCP2]|nr:FAD-dependent oxidoreductase [filamentous cyanobacterium CCP2]